MNTLVCIKPGQFEYQDRETPGQEPGRAIIKIRRIGICGTDYHAFKGTQPFFEYPRVLGHELSGELISIDGHTSEFTPGEAVTFIPYFSCGHCIACRTGHPNCCVRIEVAGVHCDGGMTQYISVPAGSLIHGDGLSFDELALAEPLAIAAHGVARASIAKDEFVLVVGAGPIGLATMEFARIAGARVIGMDVNPGRLKFCMEKLQIPFTINPLEEDSLQRLSTITHTDMPTVVIDATGSLAAINNSFKYLAHTGRYVLIGLQKGEIAFSHPEFHKREAQLMSSRNATKKDFEYVLSCIKSKAVHTDAFITHRATFGHVGEQFMQWLEPSNGVIKAMVEMD